MCSVAFGYSIFKTNCDLDSGEVSIRGFFFFLYTSLKNHQLYFLVLSLRNSHALDQTYLTSYFKFFSNICKIRIFLENSFLNLDISLLNCFVFSYCQNCLSQINPLLNIFDQCLVYSIYVTIVRYSLHFCDKNIVPFMIGRYNITANFQNIDVYVIS